MLLVIDMTDILYITVISGLKNQRFEVCVCFRFQVERATG